MQEFKATHPVELIEALMTHVGYATRTRARNALKRGEVLVNGRVVSRGSDVLEPGAQVSIHLRQNLQSPGLQAWCLPSSQLVQMSKDN